MPTNNKYSIWIKIISVVIPVVVAILFGVDAEDIGLRISSDQKRLGLRRNKISPV